jgi:hypothetical protein
MSRLDLLLNYYSQLDTVYTGLILFSSWVAVTGHLLDWMTQRHLHILVNVFWALMIVIYVAGIIFVGLKFS